jgi:uncharacterized membrane protein
LHAVSRYDWLLFLHVLAAFSLVAAEVLFSVIILGSRNLDVPSDVARIFRLSRFGEVLVNAGAIGVLVFGIWLAVDVDEYQIWDGWIIAALVLWALFAEVGRRVGKIYNAARDRARALVAENRNEPSAELNAILRSQTGLVLQAASVVIVLLFLIDMVYKPGA